MLASFAIQHREFAMASGEMSSAEFTEFLRTVFGHLAAYSTDGAIHFQCTLGRLFQTVDIGGGTPRVRQKRACHSSPDYFQYPVPRNSSPRA
jgi:hypothetical protein